jgi:hypothetical protein
MFKDAIIRIMPRSRVWETSFPRSLQLPVFGEPPKLPSGVKDAKAADPLRIKLARGAETYNTLRPLNRKLARGAETYNTLRPLKRKLARGAETYNT